MKSAIRFGWLALAAVSWSQFAGGASPSTNELGETVLIPPPIPTPQTTPAGILTEAMLRGDLPAGQPALLQVLADLGADVSGGKSVGSAIEAILLRDKVQTLMRDAVRANLLANWHSVSEFGLVTPENIERMRSGKAPLVTIGALRGQETVVVLATGESAPFKFKTSFRLIPNSLQQTVTPPPQSPRLHRFREVRRRHPGLSVCILLACSHFRRRRSGTIEAPRSIFWKSTGAKV